MSQVDDVSPAPARIRELPPALANQIAAGEVVERPASVVKELLENSLDAGAQRIEVEIEDAGVRLLRVRDDGTGIHPEDLALALSRHATSKVRTAEDLLRVASLGFRGEALASVASVSRFSLASRAVGQDRGWQVRVDGGGPLEGPVPVAQPLGTTVEVRDLFHNVPARRKFLKSARTETAHVEDAVRRLALVRFEVGLRLRVDRRDVLDLRPAAGESGRARRVAAVCGAAFLEGALQVDIPWEGMRLSGWLGLPESARSQADVQYLFLNGRPVRDRVLVHALREVYQDRVYPGRHPAYVLYLSVDPEEVDVNVHPTKQEVRFREPRLVHDFVVRSVAQALDGAPEAGDEGTGRPGAPAGPPLVGAVLREAAPAYPRGVSESRLRQWLPPGEGVPPAPRRVLGVVLDRFLLAEDPRGLSLVDLRALAVHLARRGVEAALAADEPPSRPLLVPVSVSVGPEEAEAAESCGALCASIGLDLSRSGPAVVLVRRVPAAVHDADPARLAMGVLRALADAGRSAPRELLVGALVESAAAAGTGSLSAPGQVDALLRALDALPEHERPPGLVAQVTAQALERLLGAPDGGRGP